MQHTYILDVVEIELGGNPRSHRSGSPRTGRRYGAALPAGVVAVFDGLRGEGFMAAVYEAAGNGWEIKVGTNAGLMI